MSQATDDFELLQRWRNGDQDAGAILVERQFPSVYRFFARRLSDGEAVKDLCQKTFLASVEGVDRIRDGTRLRAFFLGTARNVFMRHLRDGKRKQTADRKLGAGGIAASTSAGTRIVRRQDARLLAAALRDLPEELQLTVELYYWEGLSTAEIADVTDVAAGTVKWRLSRARELLRAGIRDGSASPPSPSTSTTEGLERWAREIRDKPRGEPETR